MTIATATKPHAEVSPGADSSSFVMPETVHEIQAFIMREQPGVNKNFARRSAEKLKKVRTVPDFYAGLRILGIHTDSTPRDAIKNLEAVPRAQS